MIIKTKFTDVFKNSRFIYPYFMCCKIQLVADDDSKMQTACHHKNLVSEENRDRKMA